MEKLQVFWFVLHLRRPDHSLADCCLHQAIFLEVPNEDAFVHVTVYQMDSIVPKRYRNLFFRLHRHLQELTLGLMESQAQLAETLALVKELEKGFAAQSKKIDDAKIEDAKIGSRSPYVGVSSKFNTGKKSVY